MENCPPQFCWIKWKHLVNDDWIDLNIDMNIDLNIDMNIDLNIDMQHNFK